MDEKQMMTKFFRTCSVCFWGILLIIYIPQNILAQGGISYWLTPFFFHALGRLFNSQSHDISTLTFGVLILQSHDISILFSVAF